VARVTALHVPVAVSSAEAITRFVPLRALLSVRPWPEHDELVRRFVAHGEGHGTGSRITGSAATPIWWQTDTPRVAFRGSSKAALGRPPVLPSVRADPDFLCGTEFSTLADEMRFFSQRGSLVDAVVIEVRLMPGELLLFDNLALAHGRRGRRAPDEFHQRVSGIEHYTLGSRSSFGTAYLPTSVAEARAPTRTPMVFRDEDPVERRISSADPVAVDGRTRWCRLRC